MVLDTSLLSTQHYKVRIKVSGAIEGMESRPPLHLSVEAIENEAFWSPSTTVANFTYMIAVSWITQLQGLRTFWLFSQQEGKPPSKKTKQKK